MSMSVTIHGYINDSDLDATPSRKEVVIKQLNNNNKMKTEEEQEEIINKNTIYI